MSILKRYFLAASLFPFILLTSFAEDPVNKTVVSFIKDCDCSYISVKILDGLQTGEAKCICPGHTIKSFHVACSVKSKNEIVKVFDCANDAGVTAVSDSPLDEKKSKVPSESKESNNAGFAK
jgi:hypothetical protein